jgi:hypothetical protein
MKNLMKDFMNEDLPLIGGGVAAGFAKNLAGKVTSNEKLQTAAPLIAGLILKRQKSSMMKYLGMGMIAVGGKELAATMIPAIKGIENMDLSGLFGGDVITDQVINDELKDDYSSREMGESGSYMDDID